MGETKICKWPEGREDFTDKYLIERHKCNRDCVSDRDYCIFHLQNKLKTVGALYDLFVQSFNAEKKNSLPDFTGFEFPDNFDIKLTDNNILSSTKPTKLGPISYRFARFGNDVYFRPCSVNARISFGGAWFGDRTKFDGIKFNDQVVFTRAIFSDYSQIINTTFEGSVLFDNVTVGNAFHIIKTNFNDKSTFDQSSFGEFTNISLTTFNDDASFIRTSFGDNTHLSFVNFEKTANFTGASNTEETKALKVAEQGSSVVWKRILNYAGELSLLFTETNFNGPSLFLSINLAKTRFAMVKLDNVSFKNSEIDQTKFISCTWGKGPENISYTQRNPIPLFKFKRQGLLYDELELRKEIEKRRWGVPIRGERLTPTDIQAQALQIKKSMEDNKDPISAGHFHFTAMEMKRLIARDEGRKNPYWSEEPRSWDRKFRAWGLWMYKMLNGYGERPGRTALWLSCLLAVFTVIFFWLDGLAPATLIKDDAIKTGAIIPLWKHWAYAFSYAFQNILPFKLGSSYLKTFGDRADWIYWLTGLETFVGSTLFTFFVLALRRRFKR